MKTNKILLGLLSLLVILLISIFVQTKSSYAAVFKPLNLAACPDGAQETYPGFGCPNNAGNNLTYCAHSADIPITLKGNPPVGTVITVSAKVEPLTCSYVQCLLRQTNPPVIRNVDATTKALMEGAGWTFTIDQLGCGGGTCSPDTASITISTQAPTGTTCTGGDGVTQLGTLQNTTMSPTVYNINCTTQPTCPATPLPAPQVTVTCPTCTQ